MIIYDIPRDPLDGWTVADVNFSTRTEALKHATMLARQQAHQGVTAMLSIEGDDGQWRLFTHQLKPV